MFVGKEGKLSAIIDFGGMGLGDPACDLVIAWTFLKTKARDIFIREIADQNAPEALVHKRIIEDVIENY